MMIDIKHETWAALQDFTPDDVADAICDSKAILEAILCNAWADVADMVRTCGATTAWSDCKSKSNKNKVQSLQSIPTTSEASNENQAQP
jgi:3-methyladenine DNA glycosylase Tag